MVCNGTTRIAVSQFTGFLSLIKLISKRIQRFGVLRTPLRNAQPDYICAPSTPLIKGSVSAVEDVGLSPVELPEIVISVVTLKCIASCAWRVVCHGTTASPITSHKVFFSDAIKIECIAGTIVDMRNTFKNALSDNIIIAPPRALSGNFCAFARACLSAVDSVEIAMLSLV